MNNETDNGISDSRYHMWRAVFAMAHMDGKVVPDEQDFMSNYLVKVPFSEEQRDQLVRDMSEPQEVGKMLEKVTDPADQSEFFYFARMMAFCDRDYDPQEQAMLETYLRNQMDKFNIGHLESYMEDFRNEAKIKREIEDQEWEKRAEEKIGLGSLIKTVFR